MQQLCSNSNFHEMICTTSVSEAMFCMPTKNFTEFYANLAITSDLLHNCNLIAANLQQFCCSMIFFLEKRGHHLFQNCSPNLSSEFGMILSINATERGLFVTYVSLLQICSILQQPGHFLETGAIRFCSQRKTVPLPTFAATPPHLHRFTKIWR